MGRPRKDSENFTCRLSTEVSQKLKKLKEQTGKSKTRIVEDSINKYADEYLVQKGQ